MITKQQLENAARAMGLFTAYFKNDQANVYVSVNKRGIYRVFSPIDPTKTDLMDLMLALDIDFRFYGKGSDNATFDNFPFCTAYGADEIEVVSIKYSGKQEEKHAALAEAVVSAASQIWESKQ